MPDRLTGLPAFDGRLLDDEAALASASDDYGHMIHDRPLAVLRPASVDDIAKLMRFAHARNIRVAVRGQAHSTHGQPQAAGGIVVDMTSLARIHQITPEDALVDAGIGWRALLQETLRHGRTPPIFTDYVDVTVGGTLAVGGVGAQTFRAGTQADNVLEMEVVTGRGDVLTCSPDQHRDLFDACRAGLGQFGVSVKARIRLATAPSAVRFYRTLHRDLDTLLAGLLALIDDPRWDGVEGFVVANDKQALLQQLGPAIEPFEPPGDAGKWLFMIEATSYDPAGSVSDDTAWLNRLAPLPRGLLVQELPYLDFICRLDPLVAALKQMGIWDVPHPWVNLMVGSEQAAAFIGEALETLAPEDVAGAILVYPYRRDRFTAPLFRVPDSRYIFKFGLLRNALPPLSEHVEQLIAANRRLYERCLHYGGTRYPIDSVPMRAGDWERHFGAAWQAVVTAKHQFDPANLLAPGQRIFG